MSSDIGRNKNIDEVIYIPEYNQVDNIVALETNNNTISTGKDKNANMVAKGEGRTVIRCSIVGDSMVGKTQTVLAFTGGTSEEYSPTIFENYAGEMSHDSEDYVISIFDLSGEHEYEDLRAFTYSDSQVFVVCYSAIDRRSFENVRAFWIPEIRKHARKKKPIILVATHTDLTDTTCYDMDTPVASTEGTQLAKDTNCACFIECVSSKESSENVFRQVATQATKVKKRRSTSSKILHKMLRR